jgi:uncharacterized protein YgiM (DUF1202 family)
MAITYKRMEENSMRIRFLLGVILCGLFYFGACAQTVERIGPQGVQVFGDPYFRPKRVYGVGVNEAWDLTIKALNREGISLEMVNKETGLIRTDYQNLSAWERGKCDLRFSPEPQRQTFIYIRCSYEGRREATEPFQDFTYSSPQEAMKAENELYRKIEPYILPFERVSKLPEAVAPRVQPASPPALSGEIPSVKAETAPPAPPAAAGGEPRLAVTPPPKVEPISPRTGLVSAPPAIAEVRPQGTTAPPKRETPPSEAARPSSLTTITPKRAEMIEKSSPVYLTIVAEANVRLAPSIQSKIIRVLKKGERVERIGESGVWAKVKLRSGEVAWVHRDFFEEMKPGAEMPDASTSSASTISPVTAQKPSSPKSAKTEEVITKYAPGTSKFTLATNAVTKMRESPSPASKVVLVLKRGREVKKIGESGEYVQVRLAWGDTGWVLARSLTRVR